MSNESYKSWHKPQANARTKQGYYKIQNPSKYIGNPNLIIYRSSWEFSFCKWCDFTPSILRWSSEPVKVPYYDRVSKLKELKKQGLDPNNPVNWIKKNYNTDFWIEIKQADESVEKWFIEIKPKNKLYKPIPPKAEAPLKIQRRFNVAAREFLINESKFAAMKTWSEQRGAKFFVFTEEHLKRFGILGGNFKHKDIK